MKKLLALLLSIVLCFSIIQVNTHTVLAAKLKLNYTYYTMSGGLTVKLKVKGKKKVKWSSTNKKVAKVTSKGKVTALKKGKCYIIAKAGKKKAKCRLKVTSNAAPSHKKFTSTTLDVLSLKINVKNVVYKGGITPVFTNDNSTFKIYLKNNKKSVKWSSSNNKIATVSKGVITAKSAGNCTITAKVKKKKYKCKVCVTNLTDTNKVAIEKNIYAMYQKINDKRIASKVRPLKVNDQLMTAASIRAKEIIPAKIVPIDKGIETDANMSHMRPNGTLYNTVFSQVGLKTPRFSGENVSYVADLATTIDEFLNTCFDAFMNSPHHKENILSPDFTHVGIGYNKDIVYKNLNGIDCIATFWSQLFYTYQ